MIAAPPVIVSLVPFSFVSSSLLRTKEFHENSHASSFFGTNEFHENQFVLRRNTEFFSLPDGARQCRMI
jgi:hypothetical protein